MTQHLPCIGGLEAHILNTLPVLTLWEPWASLFVAGVKRHETRHWATKVRGPVAIHAAKRLDLAGAPTALCDWALGEGWQKTRPLGCVVAVANLKGCFAADHLAEGRPPLLLPVQECDYLAGNYDDGRFGFCLDNVRPLICPLPLKSRQTPFWTWRPPADLDARLLPAVDHFDVARRWEARHAA
jgi:hypothetical protein